MYTLNTVFLLTKCVHWTSPLTKMCTLNTVFLLIKCVPSEHFHWLYVYRMWTFLFIKCIPPLIPYFSPRAGLRPKCNISFHNTLFYTVCFCNEPGDFGLFLCFSLRNSCYAIAMVYTVHPEIQAVSFMIIFSSILLFTF